MDVRIGVAYTPREVEVEMPDDTDRDKLRADVEAALAEDHGVLWLTDRKGRTVAVASSKITYVEIGRADDQRKVGFSVS